MSSAARRQNRNCFVRFELDDEEKKKTMAAAIDQRRHRSNERQKQLITPLSLSLSFSPSSPTHVSLSRKLQVPRRRVGDAGGEGRHQGLRLARQSSCDSSGEGDERRAVERGRGRGRHCRVFFESLGQYREERKGERELERSPSLWRLLGEKGRGKRKKK